MGLFDSIFGGSSQSSQSTSQQQSQAQSFMDPFSQRLRAGFLSSANASLFGNGVQPGLDQTLTPQLLQAQGGLLGGSADLIGQSVGNGAAGAQIGALSQLVGRQQEMGLNSIQSRFGMSGSTGSRANATGQELVGNLGIPFAQGIAGILGQQSQLGLQGAQQMSGLAGQIPGLFNTATQPQQLGNQLFGNAPILNQAQSRGTSTSSGSGSSSPGLFGQLFPFGL